MVLFFFSNTTSRVIALRRRKPKNGEYNGSKPRRRWLKTHRQQPQQNGKKMGDGTLHQNNAMEQTQEM
jgi:hypothetical protein